MKRNFLIVGIAIVVLLTISAFGIVAWTRGPGLASGQSNAMANVNQIQETPTKAEIISSSEEENQTEPSYTVLKPEISVTEKQLTATVNEVNLDPQNPSVKICSDLPSIADWLPIFSVNLNGQVVPVMQVSVLDSDKARTEINRCYLVSLSPESIDFKSISGTLVVSIDYFKILLPEKLPTDSEIVTAAKTESQKQGIDFEVQDLEHGWNINVTKKPSDMNENQAMEIVTRILETQAGRVDGPWIFTVDLDK